MWNLLKIWSNQKENNNRLKENNNRKNQYINRLPDEVQWGLITGFIAISTYSINFSSWEIFSRLSITALATFMGGWFIGFLFGIPRTLQKRAKYSNGENLDTFPTAKRQNDQSPKSNGELSETSFSANTNLEDISDWLTKIIVGVTLTQIQSIGDNVSKLVEFLAGQSEKLSTGKIVNIANFKSFILAVLVYFFIVGFIYGYLWARFNFAGISQLLEEQTKARLQTFSKNLKQDLKIQEEKDAELQRIVDQQLTVKEPPIRAEKLKETLEQATLSLRTFIIEKTINTRKRAWDETNKPLMERTIPILKALTEVCSSDEKLDQIYAELGFAYKEKVSPNYEEAKAQITEAIKRRGKPWKSQMGQYKAYYELNLAQCLIQLEDPDKDEIAQNLKVAKEAQLLTRETIQENVNQLIKSWLENNRAWLEENESQYSLLELQ